MVETENDLGSRREDGLRRTEGIGDMKLFPRAGKCIRIEHIEWNLVCDRARTTLMHLKNALKQSAIACGDGAIA